MSGFYFFIQWNIIKKVTIWFQSRTVILMLFGGTDRACFYLISHILTVLLCTYFSICKKWFPVFQIFLPWLLWSLERIRTVCFALQALLSKETTLIRVFPYVTSYRMKAPTALLVPVGPLEGSLGMRGRLTCSRSIVRMDLSAARSQYLIMWPGHGHAWTLSIVAHWCT